MSDLGHGSRTVPEMTGDDRLRVAVLGAFRVERDSREIDPGPRLQRTLLAILLVEAGAVSALLPAHIGVSQTSQITVGQDFADPLTRWPPHLTPTRQTEASPSHQDRLPRIPLPWRKRSRPLSPLALRVAFPVHPLYQHPVHVGPCPLHERAEGSACDHHN